MKIVLVNDIASDAAEIETTLRRFNHSVIADCLNEKNFFHTVVRHKPDMLVLKICRVDDRVLNNIYQLQREHPLPVLMFADKTATHDVSNILASGVSAYVVDGYDATRLKVLMEVAVARFKQISELHEELRSAKQTLEDRRVIDRAKGIIMSQRSLSEEQSYSLLRKAAMNQNKKIVEVARSIIELANVSI